MSSNSSLLRYCGRHFQSEDIDWIRHLISSNPQLHRTALVEKVCQHFGWRSPNGRLKEMSCRVAMLRMHRNGIITLPPPRINNANRRKRIQITSISDPQTSISLPASDLVPLRLQLVASSSDSSLWNQLIERCHYLGYKPLPALNCDTSSSPALTTSWLSLALALLPGRSLLVINLSDGRMINDLNY